MFISIFVNNNNNNNNNNNLFAELVSAGKM
jgi:hypothetical protein